MITLDEYGCVVENGSKDGGDSCCRNGMLATFDKSKIWSLIRFVTTSGGVRHPYQEPWNNEKNFTRDQLIPLVSGLSEAGGSLMIRFLFWAHVKRLGFCQNIDRDYPIVSRKKPWPHYYTEMETGKKVFSPFAYRDILLPDDMWHMVVAGKIWQFYWIAPVAWLLLIIKILVLKISPPNEVNQWLAKTKVAGKPFVRMFKWAVPDWKERTDKYWGEWRLQPEIAEIIKNNF